MKTVQSSHQEFYLSSFKDVAGLRRLTFLSLLLGVSIVIYILESILIPSFPLPGLKLGLANVVTFFLLAYFNWPECLFNLILRVILGSFILGTIFLPTFYISLGAGLVSTISMIVFFKLYYGHFSFVGVSLVGSAFHNVTQLIIVAYLTKSLGVFIYLPLLLFLGEIAGLFTGILGNLIVERLKGAETLKLKPVGRKERKGLGKDSSNFNTNDL